MSTTELNQFKTHFRTMVLSDAFAWVKNCIDRGYDPTIIYVALAEATDEIKNHLNEYVLPIGSKIEEAPT